MISSEALGEIDEAKEAENLKKVEAALFIAGKFLTVSELVSLTDVNPILLKQLLEKLVERYEDRAIEVVRKGDLWKMDVKQEYGEIVNKLATGNAEFTNAEQETLAIIAYKQPIKQSVIIKIRGNKAYDHIHKFREIGLVRTKRLGHTLELNLSDDFYDYFKLGKKEEQEDGEVAESGIEKSEEKVEEKKEEKVEEKSKENAVQ